MEFSLRTAPESDRESSPRLFQTAVERQSSAPPHRSGCPPMPASPCSSRLSRSLLPSPDRPSLGARRLCDRSRWNQQTSFFPVSVRLAIQLELDERHDERTEESIFVP